MFKEFKEFAMKGNLVDMAVGVVMGIAFGKVTSAFIDGMVMPLIGMISGGVDFSKAVINVQPELKDAAGKVHASSIEGLMKHAEEILPQLDMLLKKSSTSFKDISAFLIGRGPGSFTGLRVGFATLKGFLAGGEVPCYGALSLDVIALVGFCDSTVWGSQSMSSSWCLPFVPAWFGA